MHYSLVQWLAAGISDFNILLSYVLKEQFVYSIILLNQLN